MRTRMTLTAAALLPLALCSAGSAHPGRLFPEVRAQRQADPAVLVEKIDAAVATKMKRQNVPGAAVAIIRKGEVVADQRLGRGKFRAPHPGDGPYRLPVHALANSSPPRRS